MMYETHTGYFVSRDDIRWTVTILQDLEVAPESVGNLEFPDEEPLIIEWGETSKEDVICGSTAILKVISPGDRTYASLYTVRAGSIGIRVEREGQPYWKGTLDPEFYEEAYTDNEDYEVELTFSDFGIFERLKYCMTGMQTLDAILANALTRAHIDENVNSEWVSTQLTPGSGRMALGDISIRSDNFTDEDGEVSNMKDVIIGTMQPLGLRMIQRNGTVFVYDLNGIYRNAGTEKIEWHDEDQVMSVDKVANNAKVTFSPYSSSELLDGSTEFGGEYSPESVNLQDPDADFFSYYPDMSDEHLQNGSMDTYLVNFTIFLSREGKGLAHIHDGARYFHILPLVGGPSECDGIAWGFRFEAQPDQHHFLSRHILNAIGKAGSGEVMRTNRVYLPKLSTETASNYRVRLTLEMLLDPRYNPFSSAGEGNEKGNYDDIKVWTGWAFVPFSATIFGGDGTPLCHYENRLTARGAAPGYLGYTTGSWESGVGNFGDAFLEYYNVDDLEEDTGIFGWKGNRHCIGRPDNPVRRGSGLLGPLVPVDVLGRPVIFDSFKQMEDGEYMPYPPEGGYLEVSIYSGVNCYDYGEATDFDTTQQWDLKELYGKIRWLLYKAPKIELVKNNLKFEPEKADDVEYKGYINRDAKDELSIDTICGTMEEPAPTARGSYFRTSDHAMIKELTREDRTNQAEKLLIGTIYSQFAERHTKLEGTAFLLHGDLKLYTDGMQGVRKFLMLADCQDIGEGTSEIAIVEVSPDEYDAIEYEQE